MLTVSQLPNGTVYIADPDRKITLSATFVGDEILTREVAEWYARAVNAYDQLLAACRSALAYIAPDVDEEDLDGRDGMASRLARELSTAIASGNDGR